MKIINFDPTSGRVLGWSTKPDSFTSPTDSGPGRLAVTLDTDVSLDHYVDLTTMTVEERQPLPVTVSGFTVANLPGPCTMAIRGPITDEVATTDTSVTFDFAVPGFYRITITTDDPQWLEHTVEMTYGDD